MESAGVLTVETSDLHIGSGTIRIPLRDGARAAFLMWQLRQAKGDGDRMQLLWQTLANPSSGNGLLLFCIDDMIKYDAEPVVPYLVAASACTGADASWKVRRKAAIRLGHFFPTSRDALLLLSVAPDPVVAHIAQETLETKAAEVGSDSPSEQGASLPGPVANEDWRVRQRAVALLGKSEDGTALPAIVEALNDEDWFVRLAAATALGQKAAGKAVEPLSQVILHDDCWIVRHAATKSLLRLGVDPPWAVMRIAARDEDWRIRVLAINSVAAAPAMEQKNMLVDAMKDRAVGVRLAALSRLAGLLPDEKAFVAVAESLQDNDPVVKVAAARALGDKREHRAVDALLRSLADAKGFWDYGLRGSIVQALGNIGEPGVVNVLLAALKDEHPFVRKNAAQALGTLGDKSTIAYLRKASEEDEDPEVRSAATGSLSCLEGLK